MTRVQSRTRSVHTVFTVAAGSGGTFLCQCRLVRLKCRTGLLGLFHAFAARVMQAWPRGRFLSRPVALRTSANTPYTPAQQLHPLRKIMKKRPASETRTLGYSHTHFYSTVRWLIKASSFREGYWQRAARLARRPCAGFEQFTLHLRFKTLFPRQALIGSLCCSVRHLACTQLKPLFLLLASKSHIAFTQTLLPSTLLPV